MLFLCLGLVFLLVPSACTRPDPEGGGAVVAAQDTAFGGTTAALRRAPPATPGLRAAVLRDLHAEPQAGVGYDRVVFEFAGDSLPGYLVEYATRPVVRCGSGDPVAAAGSNQLVVRFEPAQAHDGQGNPTVPRRTPVAGLDLQLVCDFEGQVEWLLTAPSPLPRPSSPYRVLELTGPPRLVLDVRH